MKRSIYIVMFAFLVTVSIVMLSDSPLLATDTPLLTIAQVSESDVDTDVTKEDKYPEEVGDSGEATDAADEMDAEEDIESYEDIDPEEGKLENDVEDSDEAGEEKSGD